MRFYLVAMIFIVFDIEIIFLYPWAVIYREPRRLRPRRDAASSRSPCSCRSCTCIANGALDWGPAKRLRAAVDRWSSRRAHRATPPIRRVGLDGREPTGEEAA